MAKKKPKPPPMRIVVCDRCGEPFETREDRTHCADCPTHQAPSVDPGWKTDDEPGFSNAVRMMEDT